MYDEINYVIIFMMKSVGDNTYWLFCFYFKVKTVVCISNIPNLNKSAVNNAYDETEGRLTMFKVQRVFKDEQGKVDHISEPITVYEIKGEKWNLQFLIYDYCKFEWNWVNAENYVPYGYESWMIWGR